MKEWDTEKRTFTSLMEELITTHNLNFRGNYYCDTDNYPTKIDFGTQEERDFFTDVCNIEINAARMGWNKKALANGTKTYRYKPYKNAKLAYLYVRTHPEEFASVITDMLKEEEEEEWIMVDEHEYYIA